MSEVSQPNLVEIASKLLESKQSIVSGVDHRDVIRALLEELTESQSMLKYNQEMYDQVCESRKVVEAELEQAKKERDKLKEEIDYLKKSPLQRGMDAIRVIGEHNRKNYGDPLLDIGVIPNETE